MAKSVTRKELERSIRLLANEERWLLAGLVGGAGGYFVWLAGTGAAVPRAARAVLGTVSADPWSTDTAVLAATFAVLWVLVPSLVAVRSVVGHLTNLRGNIGRAYRVDQPLVLLVPPLALLAVVVATAVVEGSVSTTVLALGGVVNAFLLVRTVAYGYRVYSFSVPRLLQAMCFVTAVVASLAVVSRSGSLTGQTALIEAVVERYGVSELAFGDVSAGGVTAPTLPLVGAATPGVLALAYVWVQLFASLVVRMRRPDVPRSAIRAGQRYPAVVQPGTSRRLAMGTGSAPDEDAAGGDAPEAADVAEPGSDGAAVATGGSDGPGGPDGPPAEGAGADAGSGAVHAATDGSTPETVTGDTASAGRAGDPNGGADEPVGHTRVYTPPEDADLSGDEPPSGEDGPPAGVDVPDDETDVVGNEAGGTSIKNELCPICGATFAADPDRTHCPNCNAVLDTGTGEGEE